METIDPALQKLREELKILYGDTLYDLYLIGSYAKGTYSEESDIDIVVVLNGEIKVYEELHKMNNVVFDINFEHDILISIIPVAKEEFLNSQLPLFVSARKEGVKL